MFPQKNAGLFLRAQRYAISPVWQFEKGSMYCYIVKLLRQAGTQVDILAFSRFCIVFDYETA